MFTELKAVKQQHKLSKTDYEISGLSLETVFTRISL